MGIGEEGRERGIMFVMRMMNRELGVLFECRERGGENGCTFNQPYEERIREDSSLSLYDGA